MRKVESPIRSWTNPFERNEDLINSASGIVAPNSLASDLLGPQKLETVVPKSSSRIGLSQAALNFSTYYKKTILRHSVF